MIRRSYRYKFIFVSKGYYLSYCQSQTKYVGNRRLLIVLAKQQFLLLNRTKQMSLRKTQLKKMTLEEIMTRLLAETDSDNIKLINSYICQKNTLLVEKKQSLIQQIQTTRKKIQKNVHSLNYNIKDRIERKDKIILDKDSRPNTQDMTALMELFTYMEHQGTIMDQNLDYVQQLTAEIRLNFDNLNSVLGSRANNQHLDLQYQELHRKCEEQQKLRNDLLSQRNEKRNHYANIIKTIEDCRVEYEAVESKIRDTERQLIRITTYYNARMAQDKTALVELPRQAVEYQMELLSAQNRLNECEVSYQERLMREIEVKNGING